MPFLTHPFQHRTHPLHVPVGTSSENTAQECTELLLQVLERLIRLEDTIVQLAQRQAVKEWYSTEELAQLLGKAEFTVREWCRLGRVNAEKKHSGRGKFPAWAVSHDELQRIRREGLLPIRRPV